MMRRVGILRRHGTRGDDPDHAKTAGRASPAQDDADHIPLIVDQNPQVPSRISHLIEGTGDDPGPVLADMARRLVAGGAEALAMPCNTAHHYADGDPVLPFRCRFSTWWRSVAHAAQLAAGGDQIGWHARLARRAQGGAV